MGGIKHLPQIIGDHLNDGFEKIESGDFILLYTDGVTEAWIKGSIPNQRDAKLDMFGINKLVEIIEKMETMTLKISYRQF